MVGLVGWWLWGFGPLYESPDDEVVTEASPPDVGGPEGQWHPRERVAEAPKPGCRPRAERACLSGDAWWIDGCGSPHELADECGASLCREGDCEEPDPQQCDELKLGQCDGDIARGCNAGHPYAIDCTEQGRRCVQTEEGPICRVPGPDDCDDPHGTARCEGDVVVACLRGRTRRLDCASVGGRCSQRPAGGAHCVRLLSEEDAACDGCGCPPEPSEELCNGRDDDLDGFIDEGVSCGPIDVVAFMVTDESGDAPYDESDLDEAFERLEVAFSRDDDYGASFRLADVYRIDRPEYIELDEAEVQELLASGMVSPPREDFYIPVVFTEILTVGGVPRPGLATPPNGICGGHRRIDEQQPPHGVVVMAKRRWPTTLAHEIGHFLGLCHTHMPSVDAVEVHGVDDDGSEVQCTEACALLDDGICDTPVDPGPSVCEAGPECEPLCSTTDRPDPLNIMGYYPECRASFTQEQALTMRRSLALRRGWHPCIFGAGCSCDPRSNECPEGMTCRRYESEVVGEFVWRCGLDGPSIPGGVCRDPGDCGQGSLCVEPPEGEPRCVRPCRDDIACRCEVVPGFDLPLCMDDLDPPG